MRTGLFILMMVIGSFPKIVMAQEQPALRAKQFNLDGNLAIDGYDPVAYFRSNKSVKGKKGLAVSHRGIVYYFSSIENKEEFKRNPSHYEPQYGGWCAFAMGEKGEKVSIDPETFKIIDNRLYLFYNKFFNNTLKSWNKDEARLKKSADDHWEQIFK